MISDNTMDEFSLHYYRWSIDEWHREHEEGYRFIKSFNLGYVIEFIHRLIQMGTTTRVALLRACVKHYNQKGARLAGESMSFEEREMAESFRDACLIRGRSRKRESAIGHRHIKSGRDGRRLQRLVIDRVGDALNAPSESRRGGVYRFITEYREWSIVTHIDFGGHHHAISYDQSIHQGRSSDRAFRRNVLLERASVLRWLGVTQQSYWGFLEMDEEEPVAECVASLCAHFQNAVRVILSAIPGK